MMQQQPRLLTFPPARRPLRLGLACAALALVAACDQPLDADLRTFTNGFSTTPALAEVPNRPRPDDRGVISYPTYQVVVAQRDDTVRSIAGRLGFDAEALGAYNGIDPDVALRRDEVIALPSRVAEPSASTGGFASGPITPAPEVSVTTLAGDAIARAESTEPIPFQTGPEPIRHQVLPGETGFTIARAYGVDVNVLAEWNGLTGDLVVREGQYLLIPPAGAAPTSSTPIVDASAPGAGSLAPIPPSAAEPLPQEDTPPVASDGSPVKTNEEPTEAAPPEPEPEPIAPDLGAEQSAPAANNSAMTSPAQGSIIRAYAPGRNEGIDIGAPAGSPVRAAAAGTVAAITTDTAGIQIVVIRHADNLLTVYTHLTNLTVARDSTVSQGQVIGEVLAGDPSFLHFEVRRGTESVDPAEFLP